MMDILKSVILDFQEAQLENGGPRRLSMETDRGKAAVCIGVRRCEMSTYMYQVVQRLPSSGVSRENILYLNFFDDRLHNLRQAGLGLITEEVDFLVPIRKRERMPVQVCESLSKPRTRRRELAALGEAMNELGSKSGKIVTRNEEELVESGDRTIEVVPVWRFLLDLPE